MKNLSSFMNESLKYDISKGGVKQGKIKDLIKFLNGYNPYSKLPKNNPSDDKQYNLKRVYKLLGKSNYKTFEEFEKFFVKNKDNYVGIKYQWRIKKDVYECVASASPDIYFEFDSDIVPLYNF